MKISQHLVKGNAPLVLAGTFTTSATPGTRSTHAHNLRNHVGQAVTPDVVICQPTGTDNDTNQSLFNVVQVVSVDATNVVVKSPGTSVTFRLYVG